MIIDNLGVDIDCMYDKMDIYTVNLGETVGIVAPVTC